MFFHRQWQAGRGDLFPGGFLGGAGLVEVNEESIDATLKLHQPVVCASSGVEREHQSVSDVRSGARTSLFVAPLHRTCRDPSPELHTLKMLEGETGAHRENS